MKREIPVLLLAYNRPKETVRVLERLRNCGVTQLYISADGPKNKEDKALTDSVNSAISEYSAIVKSKQASPTNKGCKNGVLSGINWFFNQVDEGIILEDDCLPDSNFFDFCMELLEKYRHENAVKMIGGNNPLGSFEVNGGHFFSRIGHVWGWATWKNRWDDFNPDLPEFENFVLNQGFKKAFGPTTLASDRKELTRKSIQGKIDTWDYQWNAHILISDGLTVVPEHNLIENIGFGSSGTHTPRKPNWLCNHVTEKSIDLRTIPFIPNREYEMELALAKRLNQTANASSSFYLKKGNLAAKRLKIVSINSTDIGGGAEKICYNIHQKFIELGYDSVLLVGQKKSTESSIHKIGTDWKKQLAILNADVIHIHNLHGTPISLDEVSKISHSTHVIITLHDSWLTTGSTNHPFEIEPSLLSLLEFKDWKREIFDRRKNIVNSRIRFTAPSQWMRERLFEVHGVKAHYVPNGIDKAVSSETEIPSKRFILFVANRPETNPYKDFNTLKKAWIKANKLLRSKSCDLICLGGNPSQIKIGDNWLFVLERKTEKEVHSFMKAALFVVHSSKQDNAPLVIIEAHLSGRKVLGSLVGGIPELLDSQESKLLYSPENTSQLAEKIVLAVDELKTNKTADHASTETMTNMYLGHYLEMIHG